MLPPRIKEVKVLEDYKLLLIYENNEQRVYDMKSNLQYEAFEKLKDYELFKKSTYSWRNNIMGNRRRRKSRKLVFK